MSSILQVLNLFFFKVRLATTIQLKATAHAVLPVDLQVLILMQILII